MFKRLRILSQLPRLILLDKANRLKFGDELMCARVLEINSQVPQINQETMYT